MKKSILLSMFFLLFASVAVMAQDEEGGIEELDAPPSLDELLVRPNDIKVPIIDDFKNASFNLYDKVIEVRKAGESGGWDGQGFKVAQFNKEYFDLVKATLIMAKDIKTVPKLKLPFAMKNFIQSKKAISHSSAHIKYMKTFYSAEEMAKWEEMVKAGTEEQPATDGGGN